MSILTARLCDTSEYRIVQVSTGFISKRQAGSDADAVAGGLRARWLMCKGSEMYQTKEIRHEKLPEILTKSFDFHQCISIAAIPNAAKSRDVAKDGSSRRDEQGDEMDGK